MTTQDILKAARAARPALQQAGKEKKNAALLAMAARPSHRQSAMASRAAFFFSVPARWSAGRAPRAALRISWVVIAHLLPSFSRKSVSPPPRRPQYGRGPPAADRW